MFAGIGVWDELSVLWYVDTDEETIGMFTFLVWLLLFLLCWPLALLALIVYPFVWLILLPFRLVGIAVGGILELLKAILYLPARMLSGPNRKAA